MKTTLLLSVLLGSVSTTIAATLTGASVFSADATGSHDGNENWNTTPAGHWNLFFTSGSPNGSPNGLTGAFLNGPTDAQANINRTLTLGTNRFTIFAEAGFSGLYPFHGLNLFFNGRTTPNISVTGASRTGGAIPPFTANSSAFTVGLEGEYPHSGSGTLHFQDGNMVITLTEYYWAGSTVFNRDRVGAYNVGVSGTADFIGTITLVVESNRPAALALDAYAGISISGTIGATYRVDFATRLAPSNWITLTNIALPSSPYLYFDASGPIRSNRYYRAVLQ